MLTIKSFRKGLLGTAAIALMGATALMGAQKEASATGFAYSAIEVDNFVFTGANFASFNFSHGGTNVELGGNTDGEPADSAVGAGSVLDVPKTCIGNVAACATFGAASNDDYAGSTPAPGSPAGNYAVVDMHMDETRVTGGFMGNFGAQSGVQAGGGIGGVSSATDNELTWSFRLTQAGAVGVSWDQLIRLEVDTTLAGNFPAPGDSAVAEVTYIVTITGADDVTFLSIEETLEIENSAQATDNQTFVSNLVNQSASADLEAGIYNLNVSFGTRAVATSVNIPEPGTLGMVGIGLIGLGVAGYRRRTHLLKS
jgi:hypothetical protein